MKKILIIIFGIILHYVAFAQTPLWQLEETGFYNIGAPDTSLAALKADFFNAYPSSRYYTPVFNLIHYYGMQEKQLILDTLRIYVTKPMIWWTQYYIYQCLRGYFGDAGAIAGLDTVVAMSKEVDVRTRSIYLLAQQGYYNYYTVAESLFTTNDKTPLLGMILGLYGKQPAYYNQVKTLLEQSILNPSASYPEIASSVRILKECDSSYAVQLLQQRYQSASGDLRSFLFRELKSYDADGQPERTMESVTIEPDEFTRGDYFPSFIFITDYGMTKRYLEPFFIKFCIDWLPNEATPKNSVRHSINFFLEDFYPLPPSASTPADTLLQKLTALKDTMVAYNWVGGANYIQTLTTILNNANTKLQQGDSINTAYYITSFKNLVDTEHQDTLNTTTDFITTEAWKYLHYNAQYLLEKLPNIEPTLTTLNGSMTLTGVPTFTLTLTGEKFTIGTVAQWNGQPLPTTYISSTQLQCTINANLVQTPSIDSLSVKTVHYISNTKPFNVVTQFPQPLTPIFNCITMGQQGNYTAYFGYNNQNTVNIILPKGTQNILTSPFPLTTNPPEIFEVGTHNKTFNITTKGLLKWLLNGTEVQATAGATRCQ